MIQENSIIDWTTCAEGQNFSKTRTRAVTFHNLNRLMFLSFFIQKSETRHTLPYGNHQNAQIKQGVQGSAYGHGFP